MRFEFKLADLWVGAFWKRSVDQHVEERDGKAYLISARRLDVWICLLPCLPLHIVATGKPEESEPMEIWKSAQDVIGDKGWSPEGCTADEFLEAARAACHRKI